MKSLYKFLGAVTLLLTSGAVTASNRETLNKWRDTFQSSPAPTGINTDKDFDAFVERLQKVPGIPRVLLEKLRPVPFSGTLRYRLTVAKGGKKFRLTLSNEGATIPLVVTSTTFAAGSDAFSAKPETMRQVSFSGRKSVTVAPGAAIVSDPIDLTLADNGDLIVSVFGPKFQLTPTIGGVVETGPGDQTLSSSMTGSSRSNARPIVTAIAVRAPSSTRVIATLGDSITDGNRPTLGALHSWPEQLYRRMLREPWGQRYSVVNAGIAGNKLLSSDFMPGFGAGALERLDRDVLRINGLSHVILLIGVNDISTSGLVPGSTPPNLLAPQLIAGYRSLIERAHRRGVKVWLGTITPFGGAFLVDTPDKRKVREDINLWIRTSGEADGVIDFDQAVRDPKDPQRLRPEFDSGDHLHPNEDGSKMMGDAIDIAQFR